MIECLQNYEEIGIYAKKKTIKVFICKIKVLILRSGNIYLMPYNLHVMKHGSFGIKQQHTHINLINSKDKK